MKELQPVAVLLLVLVYFTVGAHFQPQCQLQGTPTFTDQGGGRGPRLGNGIQCIIPSYSFSCSARVTGWGACVEPPRERYDIQFQVWRVQPGSTTQYLLVGSNPFQGLSPRQSCILVDIAEEDQITVEAGDIVGFYSHLSSGEEDKDAGGVELNRQPGTELWLASGDDFNVQTCAPNSCFVTLRAEGEGSRVLSEVVRGNAPVITAVIQATEVPTPTPLPPPPPPPPPPPDTDVEDPISEDPGLMENNTDTSSEVDQNLAGGALDSGVIVGIVVGLLILVILLVVAAVVALLRHSKSNRVPITQLSNPTYEDSSTSVSYMHQTKANEQLASGSYVLAGVDYNYQALKESTEYATSGMEPAVNEGLGYTTPHEAAPAEGSAASHDTEMPAEYANTSILSYRAPDQFEFSGVWVPTEEQRMAMGSHYEVPIKSQAHQYSKPTFFVEDQTYWAPASSTSGLYAQLAAKKYREISRQQITLMEELGSGQFGQVCKGLIGRAMEVAVKTLKAGASATEQVKFLQEAAIMGQFSHPNIVKLYGVVTIGEPTMMILELLPNGDLRSFIRDIDLDDYPDQSKLQVQFLRFLRQIAAGMAYLSRKLFVHRDLAARNILLDQKLVCKIGDFGMARDLMDDTYYTFEGGKIPVRWTAPEALLFKKYSISSDVWSYGMVIFEIWSLGRKPFYDMDNENIIDLVNTGYCQPPPPGCPRAVYKLMVDCWNPSHHERLAFLGVSDYLRLPDEQLLAWTEEDSASSKKAMELGAAITASRSLYFDLQHKYKEQHTV